MGYLHLPPLTEALLFCLNYGLGFVFIHVIHGTVATKQPAMTANAIAATIGDPAGRGRDLEELTTLIARTSRTQAIAILGNVGVALPVAAVLTAGLLAALLAAGSFASVQAGEGCDKGRKGPKDDSTSTLWCPASTVSAQPSLVSTAARP